MEDRLRKFAFLVNAGSFTQAAKDLSVSQPALSAAIAKLEEELHVKLLVRGVRPLKLTPAGKLAYGAAKALVAATAGLGLRLAGLQQGQQTAIVGMIDSVASILFADNTELPGLEENVQASTVVDDSAYLLRGLEREELDVAFVVEPRSLSALLTARRVGVEPMLAVCHPDLADSLKPGTLPRFVGYDQDSTTFQLIIDALRWQRIGMQPIGYSANPDIILRLVLQQKGTAVLPYSLVRTLLEDGSLQTVGRRHPILIRRRITMVRRRDQDSLVSFTKLRRHLGQALDSLMEDARLYLRELRN